MKIAVTGATGFIGRALIQKWTSEGHELVGLVRKSRDSKLPCRLVQWSAEEPLSDPGVLAGLDAVVNLAGAPLAARRWSASVKNEIRRSRIRGTGHLVEAMRLLPAEKRPKVLVSASAIGFYGDRGEEILTDSSTGGSGFLTEVVRDWEAQARAAESLGVRVILPRFGIVLGREGGMLKKMLPVVLGSGRQWMSWIQLEDLLRLIQFCISNPNLRGALNAVSPQPVRNREFTEEFAKATHQRVLLRAPKFALRWVLGGMSEAVLSSQRVLPEKVLAEGFRFSFPDLSSAFSESYSAERYDEERKAS